MPATAPRVVLQAGDELFIVQASLPRLQEGEVHSDETVQSAPISFLRWRVPMHVGVDAPHGVPQFVFDRAIDDAHAIALWRHGSHRLKPIKELEADFQSEVKELQTTKGDFDDHLAFLDSHLVWASLAFKALSLHFLHYGPYGKAPRAYGTSLDTWYAARREAHDASISIESGLDVMLLKYGRRACGEPNDLEAERRLIAPLFPRTAELYK